MRKFKGFIEKRLKSKSTPTVFFIVFNLITLKLHGFLWKCKIYYVNWKCSYMHTVSVNLLIYLTIRNVNSETDSFFEHNTNGLLLNTFLNSKCLKSIFFFKTLTQLNWTGYIQSKGFKLLRNIQSTAWI